MDSHKAISLSVISGKGGTGKTSLAINLAHALGKKGAKTLLIDCDFGLANINVILDLLPTVSLQEVFLADVPLKDAIYPIEEGFDIIPADSGTPSCLDFTLEQRNNLIQKLNPILDEYEYIIFDIGPGISKSVMYLASMAMMNVVVITPEPGALSDGDALVKTLNTTCNIQEFFVVVNQIENKNIEDLVFKKFCDICKMHTKAEFTLLGSICFDENIFEAICKQKLLEQIFPKSKALEDIVYLAKYLVTSRDLILNSVQRKIE